MKISLTHTFIIITALLLAFMLIFGGRVHAQPNIPPKENRTAGKSSIITRPVYRDFITELASGSWKSFVLGPSSYNGGYIIDITLLAPSVDGAHVEYDLLPVYDGEQWS